jgi:hypothetical protein
MFTSLSSKEVERANEMAGREPLSNFQPIFSCGLVMVLREMHSALTSRIYNDRTQQSTSGAVFWGGELPVLTLRVKCSLFRAKAAHISRHLPA